ncbi:zinc finger CCCH domain-containing protein 19 [Tanacetum coccineum]
MCKVLFSSPGGGNGLGGEDTLDVPISREMVLEEYLVDKIDSDKRWSYRDPNGNIHGLFSLAQLRSWKDYFPSDLQIWSYYGNVKEAILLHNALSRQTNDAG